MNPNGVIVWEGPSPLDGSPIVMIMTGLATRSSNRKTGDMLQTWILRSDIPPMEALASGEDSSICGDCVHRGVFDPETGKRSERSCYVNVGQAPRSIWATFAIGRYRKVSLEDLPSLVDGRAVRLGAYGDPALVPFEVLFTLISEATMWTGYTHQWRSVDPNYARLLMASVDTEAERAAAREMGYRSFFVVPAGTTDTPERSMLCSADREVNPLNCVDCGACAGTRNGATANAVDVFIEAHGTGKKYVGAAA